MTISPENEIRLAARNLVKRFGGTLALNDVSIAFKAGEIHALVGENGAGKSTLCKIFSGAITPDSGKILLNGEEFAQLSPVIAHQQGVGMIYQEFNLIQDLPIYENLFLGKEIRNGLHVDKKRMLAKTKEVFESLKIEVDPMKNISQLSVAYCQMVEIGKAMLEEKNILILDEPTAPLTTQEVDTLFELIKRLKADGVTIIYISHRMEEILYLTDRVTIMRDGSVITTLISKETNRAEIIKHMIGRESSMNFPEQKRFTGPKETFLCAMHLKNKMLKDVSFDLKAGEMLGIAGLVGAGRTETVRAIFGADAIDSGEIYVKGQKVDMKSPLDAIKRGVVLIPEDRKRQGLHLELPIFQNMALVQLKFLSKWLVVSKKNEKALIDKYIDVLSIKLNSPKLPASSLSGGNQQKVVLAKWMATNADIFLFDEPTRGIDVGSKSEIYDLMNDLRSQGKAIIMISSELHEVIGMCDRVIVMHEGMLVGELTAGEISQENIMKLAIGGHTAEQLDKSRSGGR